ncbi:inositol 2-dehydrogenase (plasmid) [Agrobacterium sp. rho-13.3]|uniref:inositol 2-dehydrogenase n=1 Tax=Agrobacterium sp. rho-13.3 TaxID=3072980 RepID=UPI002A0E061B|nr:inositol 2-dehydrogenase [Agrobacterium sp. rho-13.3]MDX8311595.1 inositol 2-dehydrogenase [Agrobacterium sp. rho-13.3]
MLRVGLLGAGRIGRVHAINIAGHARSQLVAVSDVNAGAAQSLADLYGARPTTSDAILNDASIDAVLIATSTDTHSDLIEKAAAAGKAVLCEKPVDLSLQRAQACLDAVSNTGVPVMIGFNRRFDPNFSAIKASVTAGEVGKPELLSITSFDPAPPPLTYIKVSGGLFRDMMIHDFDMANFLMGDTPTTVHAVGTSIVDHEIGKAGDVDTAVVTLTYADGRIAVIKNSRRAVYGYDQRVELLGSEGLLSAGNVLENTVSKATQQGVTSAKPEFFFLERYMRSYAAEWDAFVNAVLDGATIPVTLKDGVAALAMAEAATQSAKSGEAVALAL